MPVDQDGGYDQGYKSVGCFWGVRPASLVRKFLATRDPRGIRVLDVGAGEGKNAAALVKAGAAVDAIECSSRAIDNGRQAFPNDEINWIHADAVQAEIPPEFYDLVISYGLIHCLGTIEAASDLLLRTQQALKPRGEYILATFNDGPHDLSAHEGFAPLLLPHSWFRSAFEGWEMLETSDRILYETHPHNNIRHYHSMTRLWARKLL